MDPQIWTVIAAIATGLLVPIVGALGIWGSKQVKKLEVKSDLQAMKQNAKDAVQAIEQLYTNEPNEIKKKMALSWAKHLNTVAGIVTTDDVQLILNESCVLELPATSTPPVSVTGDKPC